MSLLPFVGDAIVKAAFGRLTGHIYWPAPHLLLAVNDLARAVTNIRNSACIHGVAFGESRSGLAEDKFKGVLGRLGLHRRGREGDFGLQHATAIYPFQIGRA